MSWSSTGRRRTRTVADEADLVSFEWDPAKAAVDTRKHKISFEIAVRVFADPLAVTWHDRVVDGEQRWQTVGAVDGVVPLLVAHTWMENDHGEIIRIISARRLAPREKRRFAQFGTI